MGVDILAHDQPRLMFQTDGTRGFDHQKALEASAKALQSRLDVLQGERRKLEKRVSLMRPDSIDIDEHFQIARGSRHRHSRRRGALKRRAPE